MREPWAKWDGAQPLPEFPLAIWCLSEVRVVSRFESNVRLLFEKMIELGSRGESISSDFPDEVVRAAREVSWPLKENLKEGIERAIPKLSRFAWGQRFFPQILAAVTDNPEDVLAFVSCSVGQNPAYVRVAALESLAEKWPDARTRELLAGLAQKDEHDLVRMGALSVLAKQWPDTETKALLAKRAREDGEYVVRSVSAILLGGMHSKFGGLLFGGDIRALMLFSDPHKPLQREDIDKCAAKVGLPANQIDSTLAELSALFGWDVTVGARPEGAGKSSTSSKKRKKR